VIKVTFAVNSHYRVNRADLRRRAEQVLTTHKLDNVQVDISVVGTRKIRHLNETLLKHEGTTDVLSFPQHERHQPIAFPTLPKQLLHLGDVVMSYPEAKKTSQDLGISVDEQLGFYLEHSLLHLLGYHHD
jgi:probable rRNA maturation factor